MAAITVLAAAELAFKAVDVASNFLAQAQRAGNAIAKAKAEGRDHLTDAEWKAITQPADDAIQELKDAIAKAEE